MHYNIGTLAAWSCSGQHNNFSVHIWSPVVVVKQTSFCNHGDYQETKTSRQTCTLSETAQKPKVGDTLAATSAQPTTRIAVCQNLTLGDWLTVFAYVDAHCNATMSCGNRVSGSKGPVSSLEMPTPYFHLSCWSKSVFFALDVMSFFMGHKLR
jgi:hypothetical protein